MSGIDSYAVTLLEQARAFFEQAEGREDGPQKDAFLHASLLLGVSSLEAHVNAIGQELLLRKSLSLLDRSILSEVECVLDRGEFQLSGKLKMYRLEDRLEFVWRRFTKGRVPTSQAWWSGVRHAVGLRNGIVHAKTATSLSEADVRAALKSLLDCLNALYQALFRRGYPGYTRGLQSSLSL